MDNPQFQQHAVILRHFWGSFEHLFFVFWLLFIVYPFHLETQGSRLPRDACHSSRICVPVLWFVRFHSLLCSRFHDLFRSLRLLFFLLSHFCSLCCLMRCSFCSLMCRSLPCTTPKSRFPCVLGPGPSAHGRFGHCMTAAHWGVAFSFVMLNVFIDLSVCVPIH